MTINAVSGNAALGARLVELLGLEHQPIAITFHVDAPAPDGQPELPVPASCVFWMQAHERSFVTDPIDHACSVGRYTHGLAEASEIIDQPDVGALLDVGWVTMEAFTEVAKLSHLPTAISYGPLQEAAALPDVLLLRLNPRQMMEVADAIPVEFSGKPQCQILPRAADRKVVAASMGCALSRARTGMSDEELTCAVPLERLEEFVDRLEAVVATDRAVARL